MAYNTEVVLRIWMAVKTGHGEQIPELLATRLKKLDAHHDAPLEVPLPLAM